MRTVGTGAGRDGQLAGALELGVATTGTDEKMKAFCTRGAIALEAVWLRVKVRLRCVQR
jgi:hypothetical protein